MASAHKHIQEKPKDSAAELDLAIYIDADNVSWKYSASIREITQGLGVIRKAIAIGESQRFSGKAGWHTTNWVSPCPISTIGKKEECGGL